MDTNVLRLNLISLMEEICSELFLGLEEICGGLFLGLEEICLIGRDLFLG